VDFFAGLAVFDHNLKHAGQLRVKGLRQGQVEGKYVAGGGLPEGLEPAFALKAGYLVLASSPAALAQFAAVPHPVPPGETPLLRLSLSGLARMVRAHRDQVTANLADKNQVAPEVAARWVDGLLWGLGLADQLELTQRTEAGQVTWTLRLRIEAEEK
jgi:hypothetical protein